MSSIFEDGYEISITQFESEFNELQALSESIEEILETLKASEQKFRFLTENSSDIVWQLDKDFRITYINPADQKLRGYSSEEVIGTTVWETMTDEGISFLKNTIEERRSNKVDKTLPLRFEIKLKCKNGSDIWTEVNVNPNLAGDGSVNGYNGIARDITERKKFEDEIQRKNQELKELNDTKDKFFSIIAHDLRSPFQGMLGIGDYLTKEFDNLSKEEIKDFVFLLNESLLNQYTLLEDLLSWSKLHSNKIKFEKEPINILEHTNKVVQMFSTNLVNKKIHVDLRIEPALETVSDRNMYWQLMRNLISNAIKFTGHGGKIIIKATDKKNYILFDVKDNGIGISQENIDKLFRLDVHFSMEGTNKETGSGLGLILCKEIVEKHNGKIWIESELGKWTSIKFALPASNSQMPSLF